MVGSTEHKFLGYHERLQMSLLTGQLLASEEQIFSIQFDG
jgi:hypothetical protein